jgi:hypothetical protein
VGIGRSHVDLAWIWILHGSGSCMDLDLVWIWINFCIWKLQVSLIHRLQFRDIYRLLLSRAINSNLLLRAINRLLPRPINRLIPPQLRTSSVRGCRGPFSRPLVCAGAAYGDRRGDDIERIQDACLHTLPVSYPCILAPPFQRDNDHCRRLKPSSRSSSFW